MRSRLSGTRPEPQLPRVHGLSLVEDLWLSRNLERPTFEVQLDGRPSEVEAPVDGSFLYARVPLQADEHITELLGRGFQIIEVTLTLEMKPRAKSSPAPPTNFLIRRASDGDVSSIAEIARASFVQSRFYRDPAIDFDVAANIKSTWAVNLARGERGVACWVAERFGEVVGFLGATKPPGDQITVAIDLIATEPTHQGLGVGTALVKQLQRWAIRRGLGITAGTQLTNFTSVRFYESLGFRVCGSDMVFHAHC